MTIVDTFTRLSPAIEVRQQFRGADVVETLERVSREIGYPKTIRLDNVLSGDARALFRQQVSFAGVTPAISIDLPSGFHRRRNRSQP